MQIRLFTEADWPGTWAIVEPVLRAGETYPLSPDITESEAYHAWITVPAATFVAVGDAGRILGSYYIKPNQPALGAHVCNCGYVVAEESRGKGLGTALCQHSQQQAVALGFRAMQYNLVVATNTVAIHVWRNNGFTEVGVLPGAFRHPTHGYVDALVMYKQLEPLA